MPINPAIPMQVQPPQQQNIIGRLAQVAQLRNAEQQSEMNRMNMDAAKMNQGLQKLKMLSGLAADMRSLPQPERRSRAGRLAEAFEASGNQDLAQMLRSYEWTDQDASDLAALTTDAEAQWNAAEARFKALQGTPSSEIDVGGVAPQNMPLPGSGFTPSQEMGPTRSVEVPLPEVQFPAQDGQPAFSMRPQSAQQINRTKRAATIQEEEDKARIQATYRQPAAIIQEWDAWKEGQGEGDDLTFSAFKKAKTQSEYVPLPGRDVPLPADVAQQRASISAAGRTAIEPGTYMDLRDDQGRVIGAWNPKSGEFRPIPEIASGLRRTGLSATERQQLSAMEVMLEDINTLRPLAEANRGSIGAIQGRMQALKRVTIGSTPEVNELFRLSDNLADQLLRARSGAQINEQEYIRLRSLVPNPRMPESKFFSDLDSFERELQRTLEKRKSPTIGTTSADPLGILKK